MCVWLIGYNPIARIEVFICIYVQKVFMFLITFKIEDFDLRFFSYSIPGWNVGVIKLGIFLFLMV